jgi:hypothetical protein
MWSLPNRQKLETAGTVLRLVGNEKAKYALGDEWARDHENESPDL